MPKCAQCGKSRSPLFPREDGKLVCQECILAEIKSPRFLPIPVVPPAAPMQEPTASEKTKQVINTLGNAVSLLGVAIVDFCVFAYLPQYSTWAIVGTCVLLALYHPWWQHGPKRSELDKLRRTANGITQTRLIARNSWRPVWACQSCNKPGIYQTKTGQMLPCLSCGHENDSFGPNLWFGRGTDEKGRPTWLIVSDDLMRQRESGSRTKQIASPPPSDEDSRTMNLYPDDFRERYTGPRGRHRLACDYISGMTDSFALKVYSRLFEPEIGSVFDIL